MVTVINIAALRSVKISTFILLIRLLEQLFMLNYLKMIEPTHNHPHPEEETDKDYLAPLIKRPSGVRGWLTSEP